MCNHLRYLVPCALAALLAASGCADSATGARSWTVDTLSSGRIVIQNHAVVSDSVDRWNLRESFRIGSVGGAPEVTFGDIRDVELGPDGSLFVLDAQASEIRKFGMDGAHLLTFGREGEGPGELRVPAGMTFGPDGNLWVANVRNARYTAFDPADGELVEERRRPASFFVIPWPGIFDEQGRLMDAALGSDRVRTIIVLDSAFTPTDTLPQPEADPRHQIRWTEEGRLSMTTTDPFAPRPGSAPWPAGGMVYSEGEAYRLHYVDVDLDTVMTVEVMRDPVPVTDQEADSVTEIFRAFGERVAAVPEREPNVPDVKPPFDRFFVDQAGRTWVERTSAPGESAAWDVIDAEGRLVAEVPIPLDPGGPNPSVRGGRLALVSEMDGVPTVVVYEIVDGG